MKILIIDDEDRLRDSLREMLELEGHNVVSAKSGIEGIRLARQEIPELILCDITMPELDGYGVLEELQSQLSTANIPFIFLTAKSEHLNYRQGMVLGADDYLIKPIFDEELLTAIHSRITKRHRIEAEQYQLFAKQLVALQEQEQVRFADLLQNEFYYKLTDIRLLLKLSQDLPHSAIHSVVDNIIHSIDDLSQKSIRISEEIHPRILEDVGLIATLEWYLEELDIQTSLQHESIVNPMQKQIERSVYRLVKEAIKFTKSWCDVLLWQDDDVLHVQIELEPNTSVSTSRRQSLIMLMQEHIQNVEGKFDIQFDGTIRIHTLFENPEENVSSEILPKVKPKNVISTSMQLHCLIVTVHPILGDMLQKYLSTKLSIEVTAISYLDLEKSELLKNNFDILIVDRYKGIKPFIAQFPTIFLSTYESHIFFKQLFDFGVQSIVLKEYMVEDIGTAIEHIVDGKHFVSPITGFDVSIIEPLNPNRQQNSVLDVNRVLTRREYEILELILEDKTHMEIAKELSISHRTVEKHRSNIMHKLGLNTHTELILFAVRHQLISSD